MEKVQVVQEVLYLLKNFATLCAANTSSLEAIRAEIGETLARRRNFIAVSLDAFACLNGRVPTVDEEFDCQQEQGGQVCSSRLWRYAE